MTADRAQSTLASLFPAAFPSSIGEVRIAPEAMQEIQAEYVREAGELWNEAMQGAPGSAPATGSPLLPKDRRFAAPQWQGAAGPAWIASMYLLNARTLTRLADRITGDDKTRERIRFAVQQWIDMASPSNFLALNPEALQKALDTKGESIAQGMRHLLNDVKQGHLSQTDESQFEVGRNVATTPGSVVFENEVFQLLEYAPSTATVHERPLLIVPPCINKYYILDLQPENSLIRYAVDQGHRVFVISWRNADDSMSRLDWDDYIQEGPIRAIEVACDIAGSPQLDTLGFCVGGTILATALAVLEARGERPASSMTLLTTFLDFDDTGVLDVFVDEASVQLRELTIGRQSAAQGGLLRGQELASAFSFLRPNELVWNYVVGNYLKGEMPPAFDLLYWNADSTNLPGPMYCTYLRKGYLENRMREPGAMTVCGQPLDFRRIQAPSYIYASREDHIVPWTSAYRSTQLLAGPIRFVLGASGHIAGVINPPAKKKRSYWAAPALPAPGGRRGAKASVAALPDDSALWLSGASENPGSWWPDWSRWLAPMSGRQVPAPKAPGNRRYPAIEPAPGRYVRQKA